MNSPIALVTSYLTLTHLVATLAVAASAAPARPPKAEPRLTVDSSPIQPGPEWTWNLSFQVHNPYESGLYLDSLSCEIEDLDPGETRAPRKTRLDISNLLKLVSAVPPGEFVSFQYSTPATAERAKLTFGLHAHRSEGARVSFGTVVNAEPGESSSRLPSRFLDVSGRRIEYVLIPSSLDSLPAPGLLLVHGHGYHARKMLPMAELLASRGYAVLLVSMPGYGQSQGPADFMGPATLQALMATCDELKKSSRVDPQRLGAWGVSRGATAVTQLAARRNDLKAVIAQSGAYDLWAAYRGTTVAGLREAIVAEAGSDSAGWAERSPALHPETIRAPLLILHGEGDVNAPAAQAHGFHQALQARGHTVEARFFPSAEHALPRADVRRTALEFLARHLGR